MSNLKALRGRIGSVRSTRKLTAAMKMVAAAKLRRARKAAEDAVPCAEAALRLAQSLVRRSVRAENAPPLAVGRSGAGHGAHRHLVLCAAADRGLCGSFNANIARNARDLIARLKGENVRVMIMCLGRKAETLMRRSHASLVLEEETPFSAESGLAATEAVASRIVALVDDEKADAVTLIHAHFDSPIRQTVMRSALVPLPSGAPQEGDDLGLWEPEEERILDALLPFTLTARLAAALAQNAACEQAARMTAMDGATRNAGEMIDRLVLVYNRTRQAMITRELIEIISGR